MLRTKNRLLQWAPLLATLLLAAVTLTAYTLTEAERRFVVYLQVPAAALVPAALPIAGIIMKKRLPIIINALIALHTVLSCDLGSALGFYWRVGCWDLLMHGYFGFLAGATIYALFMRWNGAALAPAGLFVLLFLGTMGAAAVWEIFEYACDLVLGGDAQRVREALAAGVSPVKDTMTDIIVANAGLAVFYLCLFLDKLGGYRACRRLGLR